MIVFAALLETLAVVSEDEYLVLMSGRLEIVGQTEFFLSPEKTRF